MNQKVDISIMDMIKSTYFDSFKHSGFFESLVFKDVKNYLTFE